MPFWLLRTPLLLLLLLVAAAGCGDPSGPGPDPDPVENTRDERWRADLRQVVTQLPLHHPNLFLRIRREDWERTAAQLHADIPALQDHEVVVRLMHLVAQARDSHTTLHSAFATFRIHPIEVEWFDDGLHVVSTVPEHRALRGARVLRIGGLELDSAYARVVPMLPHENQYWARTLSTRYLVTPEILHALRIAPGKDEAQWEFQARDGSRSTVTLRPVPSARESEWTGTVPEGPVPLYRQNPAAYYWHRYLEPSRTLFIQVNGGAEWSQLPFATFVRQVTSVLDSERVDRILVDLRYNTGGNMAVIWPLIDRIAERPINQRGRLYVAIGNRTVSAGMINAVDFTRRTRAILVGQPTGGKPNAYMTATGLVTLPNSGLQVRHSTSFFQTLPGDDSPAVMPTVQIPTTAALYFSGRDPVLEWMLEQPLPQ